MNIRLYDISALSDKESLLVESLNILKKTQLSVDDAVTIKGSHFAVGDVEYAYSSMDFPPDIILPGDKDKVKLEGTLCDIRFTVSRDAMDFASNLPKGGRTNLIKIFSTIYKVIVTVSGAKSPDNLLLTSHDASGYFPYYNNLTKTNKILGYSRKAIIHWEQKGQSLTSIVLKRV